MSSEEEEEAPPVEVQDRIGEADEDTLRIMLSTDNHLGYCERDPVRGLDSFAAFEEVLSLAREKQCDMVLIAGDLFHDNKPSRRTLHKTMEIIRRYCMGPNPVQVKIVSDQASNFRSVHGTVNYEDEFYSVDLPIFSIHGNHDDPTREGGTEMLSALDLLSVSNLVNYFGRQDEVDKVEISPVLMEKGTTKVAMYGMGSMRDERLNRMWQGKKVRFLRPDGDEEEEEENTWFNIFALHQNRDLGRGAKNCVHESMIPEWMDLVVWGHEHECRIDPQESVVGTFRITQPGSSVATSLTAGEAVRKHVGILDIRGNQFRLVNIPLTQVRSFVIGEVSLKDQEYTLDSEDPKIDAKVTKLLNEEVDLLVYQAKEKTEELLEEAKVQGNNAGDKHNPHQLHYRLQKPNEVLVRLKVEHSGFSTLNNQRFGAKFVGKVANPSDVLLFHRKRQETSKSSAKRKKSDALNQPMPPAELEEMNIEDLAKEELEKSDKKLEILNEQRLGLALDDFVSKEQKLAIGDAMGDMLKKQQNKLIRHGSGVDTSSAVRDSVTQQAEKHREEVAMEEDEEQERSQNRAAARQRKRRPADDDSDNKENLSDDDDMVTRQAPRKRTKAAASRPKSTSSRSSKTSSRSRSVDFSDEDEEEVVEAPPPSRFRARPQRRATSSQTKYKYDSDSENLDEDSEAVVEIQDSDDDDIEDMEEETPKPKKRGRATTSKSAPTKKTPSRQSQLSFTSSKRGTAKSSSSRTGSRRKPTKHKKVVEIDDSDDDGVGLTNSVGLNDGWGTAPTPSMK